MTEKWGPAIEDRFLTENLDEFKDVIRAALISMGFEDGSIHSPPPCTFSPPTTTADASPPERLTPERSSVSADHAGFAANLENGWRNYSPSGSASADNTVRPASADPSVGGTGRSSNLHTGAPWRQGPSASGHPRQKPRNRKTWTSEHAKNSLISTFLASNPGESPIELGHQGQYLRFRKLLRGYISGGTRYGVLVQRARKDPNSKDFLSCWRNGTCPISGRSHMWEPSGGDMPIVDRPQPFTVSNSFHITRRNFFIYADQYCCKTGANAVCVFELNFIIAAYQLLFWLAAGNHSGNWDSGAVFHTFGNPDNSAYSIERLFDDDSGGRNFAAATNLSDAINLTLLNVALYPNEVIWVHTETKELNAMEQLRFEHMAMIQCGKCTYNPLGTKSELFEANRRPRLDAMLEDVTRYRSGEAFSAIQLVGGPPHARELFLALVWQACFKKAVGVFNGNETTGST